MSWKRPTELINRLLRRPEPVVEEVRGHYSPALDRGMDFDIYLPPDYHFGRKRYYPLLLCNDGQDLPGMNFSGILEELYRQQQVPYLIAVGLYCNHDRIREYGVTRQADYKGRGDKAPRYRDFIVTELFPYLHRQYRYSGETAETAIAGFSLGGLSAFDLGWQFPQLFGVVGVFSGSFWWRSHALDMKHPDAHRIMHDIVHKTPKSERQQRFWFQCGTNDEDSDRNNNGIIDVIDDTLDLIKEIKHKGIHADDIRYLEVQGGEHHPRTWAGAMPDFLRWAFVPRTGSWGR